MLGFFFVIFYLGGTEKSRNKNLLTYSLLKWQNIQKVRKLQHIESDLRGYITHKSSMNRKLSVTFRFLLGEYLVHAVNKWYLNCIWGIKLLSFSNISRISRIYGLLAYIRVTKKIYVILRNALFEFRFIISYAVKYVYYRYINY